MDEPDTVVEAIVSVVGDVGNYLQAFVLLVVLCWFGLAPVFEPTGWHGLPVTLTTAAVGVAFVVSVPFGIADCSTGRLTTFALTSFFTLCWLGMFLCLLLVAFGGIPTDSTLTAMVASFVVVSYGVAFIDTYVSSLC
ncbi:hypothetical protein C440_04283 [Haloferax mucosum ATCC BAA-1512]|uniref:Uncharacterized protein n=1 Tax=Haloferax mucosum ATCC BAA-1512 TaxID=662479 RepID=M0INC4_9EURY|nr:hypothetical protein [Haloferax mucosum]ELZ96964.1 hypothetical protein C440_04283 [Haloferax mucosum ATCC BAA-1512]